MEADDLNNISLASMAVTAGLWLSWVATDEVALLLLGGIVYLFGFVTLLLHVAMMLDQYLRGVQLDGEPLLNT